MRTTTEAPVARFVTRTCVSNGSHGLAAVNARGSNGSPDAVVAPSNPGPYQVASP
jgi:hypothetical protein